MITNSSTAKSYKHNQLKVWGAGAEDDKDDRYWQAVVRQALVNSFLSKDIETYGQIKLTEKGKSFLKKPFSIKFTRDNDYENTDSDSGDEDIVMNGKGAGGGSDEVLFNMLKDEVKKISKKTGLPPYVIFQEPSLEEMTFQYPITLDELSKISFASDQTSQIVLFFHQQVF